MSNYKRRRYSGNNSRAPRSRGRQSSGKKILSTVLAVAAAFACIALIATTLRPSGNSANPPAKVEIRDINTGPLTIAEKFAIASVGPAELKNKVWFVDTLATTVYKSANIDVSSYFGTYEYVNKPLTTYWVGEALFGWSGNFRQLRDEADPAYVENCRAMLVEGYYGGVNFNESKTFTIADFEVGDLFCGYKYVSGKNLYYTAIYQGNGVFLAVDQTSGEYVYSHDLVTVFADDIGSTFAMYYVLRPSQLAAVEN